MLAPLLDAAVLCNDAELVAPPPEAGEHGGWTVLGDPTEGALRVLAAKAGRDGAALRAAAPRHAELPFDADTQMMATWNGAQVWIKGAPEAVLRLCRPEDEALHARARAQAEAMAARAWRVLAFAVAEDAAPDASGGFAALQGRAGCSAWSPRSTRRARKCARRWRNAAAPASAPSWSPATIA